MDVDSMLTPCPTCRRHIFVEDDCPFCRAPRRLRAGVLAIGLAATLSGCPEDVGQPLYGIPPVEDAGPSDASPSDASPSDASVSDGQVSAVDRGED